MLSDIEELSVRESSCSNSASTLTPLRHSSRGPGGSAQNRRSSTLYSHRPSITAQRYDRSQQQVPAAQQLKLDNTYRMDPDDRQRFQPRVVQHIIGTVTKGAAYTGKTVVWFRHSKGLSFREAAKNLF